MNFLLDINYHAGVFDEVGANDFLETVGFGAQMVLIGMVTVFAVLFILWGILLLFKFFFHDLGNKKPAKEAEPAPVLNTKVAPVYNESEEIVAVIAAAIAMAESESGGIKFRVVSFKRK
ncbi:MAG: OadG family protein [Clostridia bacterium]|nr:OadG family protein [Clostridia bacterium]